MEPMRRWTAIELARPDGRIITARECWLSVIGVEASEYRCRKCEEPPRDVGGFPPGYCQQTTGPKRSRCGCPLPRRCVSCDTIVEPTRDPADGHWFQPESYCEACENENRRQALGETLRRVVPFQLRAAAKEFYHRTPHREALVDSLRRWVEVDKLGSAGGPSCVLAWGSRGSGKSVAAAWLVGRALMSRAVLGALYVTEDELTRAAIGQFSDDRSENAQSRTMLKSCLSTPLLVIDELGSNRGHGYSPRESKEVIRVLHSRLSDRRPMLLVSNLAPTFVDSERRDSHLGWLDERIDSRFEGNGHAIQCTGPDMRIDV